MVHCEDRNSKRAGMGLEGVLPGQDGEGVDMNSIRD